MLLTGSIQILLIDEQTLVRAGLRKLIESEPSMRLVGDAGNSRDAQALAARLQPDIILLELDLGDEHGLDLIVNLIAVARQAQIIVLTNVRDRQQQIAAVRQGVKGIVMKNQAPEVLFKAIKRVAAGEVWLDRAIMAETITSMSSKGEQPEDPESAKIATLTARERQIITLIARGLKNKQIAAQLYISETSVRHYLTIIFHKLNLSDRLELATYAYGHGLAQLPASRCS